MRDFHLERIFTFVREDWKLPSLITKTESVSLRKGDHFHSIVAEGELQERARIVRR